MFQAEISSRVHSFDPPALMRTKTDAFSCQIINNILRRVFSQSRDNAFSRMDIREASVYCNFTNGNDIPALPPLKKMLAGFNMILFYIYLHNLSQASSSRETVRLPHSTPKLFAVITHSGLEDVRSPAALFYCGCLNAWESVCHPVCARSPSAAGIPGQCRGGWFSPRHWLSRQPVPRKTMDPLWKEEWCQMDVFSFV